MKPFLFSLALLPAVVFGQWEASVFGGVGLGRLPTDLRPATGRGESQKVFFGPGWAAGVAVSHALSKPLRFTTGLHWACISGRDEYWLQGGFLWSSAERRLGYAVLPMLLEAEAGRFRLGGGFQLGLLALQHGRFTYDLRYLPDSYQEFETNDLGLRRFDIGVAAQASVLISPRWRVGLRYYRGLSDIKDHSDMYLSPLWTEQAVLTGAYQLLPRKRTALRDAAAPDEPSVD
jgi:hypothetical protein